LRVGVRSRLALRMPRDTCARLSISRGSAVGRIRGELTRVPSDAQLGRRQRSLSPLHPATALR
jgi:hypothetical protein